MQSAPDPSTVNPLADATAPEIAHTPPETRVWLWLSLGLLAYLVTWLVLVFGNLVSNDSARLVGASGRIPLLVIGLYLGWRAWSGEAETRWRTPWLFVVLAMTSVFFGELIWSYRHYTSGRPDGISISDVLFLSYFLLLLTGLTQLPRFFRSRFQVAIFSLDAAAVAIGSGMLMWFFGLRPRILDTPSATWQDQFLALAYPIGDLLSLLGIAIVLLRLPAGHYRRVYLLVAVMVVFSLLGDLVYASGNMIAASSAGSLQQFLWLMQAVIFILAAKMQQIASRNPMANAASATSERTFQWLPAAAVTVACGLVVWVTFRHDMNALRVLSVASVALMLVVLWRQWFSRKESAQLLSAQIRERDEARFAALVEQASDGVVLFNYNGAVEFRSAAFIRQFNEVEKTHEDLLRRIHVDDQARVREIFNECWRKLGSVMRMQARARTRDERWIVVDAILTNMMQNEAVNGVVVNFRDVTEALDLQEKLKHDATHHRVSGLPNRTALLTNLRQQMAEKQEGHLGLLVLTPDQYQLLHESLGHVASDALMRAIGERLRSWYDTNCLSQNRDQEFALIFQKPAPQIDAFIDQLCRLFDEPLRVGDKTLLTTLSIGVACSSDVADGDAEGLLRNAEIAMKKAIEEGRNRVEYFRSDDLRTLSSRFALVESLPRLLENDAFRVLFRPYVDALNLTPTAIEVDVGWTKTQDQPAIDFEMLWEISDEAGMAPALMRWVIAHLRRDLAALMQYQPETLGIGVILRMSPSQLLNAEVVEELESFLRALEMRVRHFHIQLTGINRMPDREAVLSVLRRLHADGVSFLVGNTGEQATPLAVLDAIPLAGLKVSPLLLAERRSEDGRPPILKGVVALARAVELRLIAVQVNTEEQHQIWKHYGMDWVGGDWVGPPMPYEKLLLWMGRKYAEMQ